MLATMLYDANAAIEYGHRLTKSVDPKHRSSQVYSDGFQGFRDHFPRNPWIHFCDGCFEVYLPF